MRIVLVDPSRAVQRAMTQLIKHGGHDVLAFADGREALACVKSDDSVRTLITSTQPNGIAGVALCMAARNLVGSERALYVMMMSSTGDHDLVIKALDHGADDFIHKPPIPDELRARLRLADRVTSMQQELIRHATLDFLTGLLNRRVFFERAARACHGVDAGGSLSAIMFDIDRFKRINDTCGHDVGDSVLAAVGRQTSAVEGIAGRLGGEEFAILVQGDLVDAYEQASNLQFALRSLRFDHKAGRFGITCSFGVAEWEAGDTIDRLLRRADVALYEAKNSGRDRIIASDTFALTSGHDEWRGSARRPRRSNS